MSTDFKGITADQLETLAKHNNNIVITAIVDGNPVSARIEIRPDNKYTAVNIRAMKEVLKAFTDKVYEDTGIILGD